MPVRASEIAGLGHRDRHHSHLGSAKVAEVSLVIGCGVDCRNRPHDVKGVPFGTPGDQGVQPVLRREGFGCIRSATGECSNSPSGSIRGVRRVPGLMGAVEVAQAEVHESDRRRGETEQRAAEPGQIGHISS
jgi:hypothetical protein